jgi:penicillin-binding protein 2
METKQTNVQVIIFKTLVVAGFAVLAFQSWQLQIVQGEQYIARADRNRFRLVSVDAPRGIIYDRAGRLLAGNVPSFTVSIVPADLPEEQEDYVFQRLSKILQIPVTSHDRGTQKDPSIDRHYLSNAEAYQPQPQMRELVDSGRETPFTAVLIKSKVERDVAFTIEEEHLQLPGVVVGVEPLREYISGTVVSHVIGYVGHIPEQEVANFVDRKDADYDANDIVGLTGVELTFEEELRGRKGQKHIEVDVTGRDIRTIGPPIEPVPGHNLVLTIDLDLQVAAYEALRKGIAEADSESGVAIAMDPQTGEILAMVSLPTYDNNLFIGGISQEEYAELAEDPRHPLVNHAISGQYPPGSTFKIVTAVAGLEEGVVDLRSVIFCPGTIWIPHRFAPDDPELAQPFNCWYREGHRSMSIIEAIAQSCDIYFGVMAGGYGDFKGLGQEALHSYGLLFGIGRPSGVELPGESAGLVPDETWKRLTYGQTWVTGDTFNAAIGQGFVLATPLQIVNATSVIANGGTLYEPQIVREIKDVGGNVVRPFTPKPIRELPVSSEALTAVGQGMRAVMTHGTAWQVTVPGIAVAGKTGTAEFPGQRDWEGNLPTHAWFTAFAPFDDPQIAVVVFVESGGEGGQVAAPIAAEILAHYFGVPLPE